MCVWISRLVIDANTLCIITLKEGKGSLYAARSNLIQRLSSAQLTLKQTGTVIQKLAKNKGLLTASAIWCVAIIAGLYGAYFRGIETAILLPYAIAGFAPAIFTFLCFPLVHKEWAQNLVVFAWLAMAIAACIGLTFLPFVALFLAPPAIAALFQKEKVIEAMLFSAVFAVIVFYLDMKGLVPATLASPTVVQWAQNTGLMALAFLIVASMYGAAQSNKPEIDIDTKRSEEMSVEKALLQAVPGASLRVSSKGNVVYSTKRSLNVFGVSSVAKKVSTDFLFEEDPSANAQLKSLIARVRSVSSALTEIIPVRTDLDDLKQFEVTAKSLPNRQVGLYAIDVTEREARYEKLKLGVENAYQDATGKTLFFAGVSHELRTPLNAIIGFSDMMRSRLFGPLPNKYAEYADLIHNSGQHMLDLIGDVLDMTKVDAGKYGLHYSSFDIADVIRSTMKMIRPMADDAEITLDAEIQTHDDLIVKADRKAVRQILLNLISNAIKFTPKGGRVVVSAKIAGGTLNLMVSDDGVGMSAEDLKTIGTPFTQGASAVTSDERGSGLGLSLVKSLAELHGGRVSFASQPDAGTTVDVYIPLTPDDL